MQAGTFALFMGLISCVHCVLLISLFQRDYETVNFNNLLLPRHYDDLPTSTQVSYRNWKHCAPRRISIEVYEVSSASPKPLDVHVFLCELSILASWQHIYLNCLKIKLSSLSLSPSPTPVWHVHIMIIFPRNSLTCL